MEKKEFLKLKEQYWNLYYVEIEGEEFLFRELSRSEYKNGIRLYGEDVTSLEEYICGICVFEPVDYDFEECIAGIPSSLSDFILHESGFTEDTGKLNEYMNKYRNEMKTLDNQIACVIKEAFPDLNIEDIENLSMEKTVWYYSRAEYILNTLRGRDIEIGMTGNEEVDPINRPVEKSNEEVKKPEFNLDVEGSASDFSELSEIQSFMRGKWMPPARTEGEELL